MQQQTPESGSRKQDRAGFGEQMVSSRLLKSILIMLLLLHGTLFAGKADAQTATMEDLIGAQAQGASEAELIAIYHSGLSVNSRNSYGATPLQVACAGKGYLYFAKMLLNEGADVNGIRRGGWTALMDACSEPGKAQIVRLLLDYGAQADRKKFDGRSALHLAASINNYDAARVLVEAKANVNLPDNNGRTPMYYVTSVEVARLLIENGARLNIVDRTRITPYHFIRMREKELYGRGESDLSSYLKSLGAQ